MEHTTSGTKNLNDLQGFDLAFTREGSLWKLTAKKGDLILTATALDRATAIWQVASEYKRLKLKPRPRLLPIITYTLYLVAITIIALTFIIFLEWPR